MARGHSDSAPSSSTSTVPTRSPTRSPRFRLRPATATCFQWDGPIQDAVEHLKRHRVQVELGPVERNGVEAAGSASFPRSRRKPSSLPKLRSSSRKPGTELSWLLHRRRSGHDAQAAAVEADSARAEAPPPAGAGFNRACRSSKKNWCLRSGGSGPATRPAMDREKRHPRAPRGAAEIAGGHRAPPAGQELVVLSQAAPRELFGLGGNHASRS